MPAEVQRALDLVQLGKLGGRRPHQLSGGQRQRVALARAIVTKPRVLLLDEPLGALDKALRVDMQIELKRIQREIGITTIFVTHDQEEALTMSDRIGILRDGRLVQEGPPEEIYDQPEERVRRHLPRRRQHLARRHAPATAFACRTARRSPPARAQRLPPAPRPAAPCGPNASASPPMPASRMRPMRNMLKGQVSKRIFAGNNSTYFVERGGQTLKVIVQNTGVEQAGRGAGGGAALVAGEHGADRWVSAEVVPDTIHPRP